MCSQKVWLRFEKRKKDGTVLKLRIQDLPPERIDEAIELKLKYFARDEIVHKAVGITNNPAAVEAYLEYLNMTFRDPSSRITICCQDTEENQDIMGISGVAEIKDKISWDKVIEMCEAMGTDEIKKLLAIFHEASQLYDPMKENQLSLYYDDKGVLVLPDYRGFGISEQLFTVRRLMCGAHGVPMTGAWMTGFASQKGAARDGWTTVAEIQYDDLAERHGVTFTDAPPTMKFMIAQPLNEKSIAEV